MPTHKSSHGKGKSRKRTNAQIRRSIDDTLRASPASSVVVENATVQGFTIPDDAPICLAGQISKMDSTPQLSNQIAETMRRPYDSPASYEQIEGVRARHEDAHKRIAVAIDTFDRLSPSHPDEPRAAERLVTAMRDLVTTRQALLYLARSL